MNKLTAMQLPDAQDRETILRGLDANLVVEAAAGTGKTTAMVGRITNLLERGDRNFAAVTFTLKAAAELRRRLEAKTGADTLADCHIGTIHSFCARLLRERPVEAGIAPDFREIDDSEDSLLRAQAWNAFARDLSVGKHKDLYAIFETFGLDLDTLGQGFLTFADYPDMDEWSGRDAGMHQIDAESFITGTEQYTRALAPLADALKTADPGTDALMPILKILLARFPRLKRPIALADAYRLAALFKSAPKITQKQWLPLGLDKDAALELAAAYQRFHDETALPFRNACLAAVYAAALEAYHLARDSYDALRRESGAVNFQDLLLTTARLLREHPEVRADFAEQYARLLVDEVQDTDPVQAEIMFLLASSRPRERDWRRCPPRPGALFIVGDPKQSIYRFRRADIAVYQEIKRLIRESGGEVLSLSANFRSRPDVLEWINETFSPEFGEEETPHSPAYVPLRPGLEPCGTEAFHGVYRLETLAVSKKENIAGQDVLQNEATRIARFIRHAVDAKLPVPDRAGTHPAQPGDFLIITYEKSKAAWYADAVRALGIECQLSGGGTLGASRPLQLLTEYLTAIDNPDDPVALVAVLRGDLFGVSDPELYAWKKAEKKNDDENSRIAKILTQMRAHAALARDNNPASALPAIADDLGLWALAATEDDPSTQTGALATALELLKTDAPGLPTLGSTLERLAWLMDTYDKDPLPATAQNPNAVRVMNLHKTKGLEAPVVFLTSTRGQRPHDPRLAVRRTDGTTRGALALFGGQYGATLLARPQNWPELEEEETRFLNAEKTRLNYVAATRAGAALVVSVHPSEKTWKTAFLPRYKHETTIPAKLPEPTGTFTTQTQTTTDQIDLTPLDAALDHIAETRKNLRTPTYETKTAKQESPLSADKNTQNAERAESPVPADQAAAYGEVLHRALTGANIKDLVKEFDLPARVIETIESTIKKVHNSEIWRRAQTSKEMYQEAPFSLWTGSTLTRGTIDLIFREEKGWVIVDFKSDALPAAKVPAAAPRHAPQLRAYAAAWRRLTGEPVAETALYFLHPDVYHKVDVEEQATLF